MARKRWFLASATGGALGAAAWWRTHPSPCPYGQRFWVEAPHPIITRKRLLEILSPAPAEQLLELGPGTGYYTLPVARRLDGGRLCIVDIQQQMLDHTMRRAGEVGISNIEPACADAVSLPYTDRTFERRVHGHHPRRGPASSPGPAGAGPGPEAFGPAGRGRAAGRSAHGHLRLAAWPRPRNRPARGAPPRRSPRLLRAAPPH